MSSGKVQKRLMKLKGVFWQGYSWLALRHSPLNRRSLARRIENLAVDKLHVGCGDVLLSGWLNILFEQRQEYGRVKNIQGTWLLNFNLHKPWPVGDERMSVIAGSHFIEHLDLNAGLRFAREAFRVLKTGGVLRLSCPDLELYARRYVEKNSAFFQHPLIREWCTFKAAATPGEIFIAKAYDSGGAHKWFYDFESLRHVLINAGFREVNRVGRKEGKTPDLDKLEPAARELETLYVEAVK